MNALVDHKAFAAATTVSPDVSLFDLKGHQIRVVTIGGEPWFAGHDICSTLAIGPSEYRRLDETEKTYLPRTQLGMPAGRPAMLISESGLHKLVLRSDKPEAKPFQDWVTKEVLPAIRKDGAYVMGEEKVLKAEIGSRLCGHASYPQLQRSNSSPSLLGRVGAALHPS